MFDITFVLLSRRSDQITESLKDITQLLLDARVTTDVVPSGAAKDTADKIGTYDADAVLLDPWTIPRDSDLEALRRKYPHIPIILVSADPEFLTEYLNLNTQGALPIATKKWTSENISARYLQDALNNIANVIQQYKNHKNLMTLSLADGVIRKSAPQASMIADQIHFLKKMQKTPSLKDLFPPVTQSWSDSERFYYEMPFYRMDSFRQILFAHVDFTECLREARLILGHLMSNCVENLHAFNRIDQVPPAFVQSACFEKFDQRITRFRSLLDNFETQNRPEDSRAVELALRLLREMLDKPRIQIGDEVLLNPQTIINALRERSAFSEGLQPKFLCCTHGDLHFDNILVDRRTRELVSIKLVDPRGFSYPGCPIGTGDPAYDIGKLLHSANGEYDLIESGLQFIELQACRTESELLRLPAFRTSNEIREIERSGGSGALITSYHRPLKPWLSTIYSELADQIREHVRRHEQGSDPSLLLRAELHEAINFLTMGPSHLHQHPSTTLALHARGIQLLNRFYQRFLATPDNGGKHRTGEQVG